ncbi:MAG TPA: hypothetical protein DCF68_17240 [Cyanothece sp. UBA12306]|nr:hypothetical protein [Cyanothece sp. UBA12306]
MTNIPDINSKKFKFISFRWKILLLILTPLLLGIISVQLILWLTIGQKNKEQKKDFRDKTKEKVKIYLESRKNEIEKITSINKAALANKDIDLNNLSSLEKFFWYQMKYNLQLDKIYYANEQGDWIQVKRDERDKFEQNEQDEQLFSEIKNSNTEGQFLEYNLDQNGNRKGTPKPIRQEGYEPSNRYWYEQGKNHTAEFAWIHSFNRIDNSLDAISFYQRVVNPSTNKLEGILAIDIKFTRFEKYLSDINQIENMGILLIMDCSSILDKKRFSDVIVQGKSTNGKQIEVSQKIIKKVKKSDQCQQVSPKEEEGKENKLTIENYEINILPLNIIPEFHWLLVIAFPNNYFVESTRQLTLLILLGGIILSIMATILSIFISRKFSKSITIITDTAEAIQLKNFEDIDLTKLEKTSHKNDEIGILAKVFLGIIKTIYKREQSLEEQIEKLQKSTNLFINSSFFEEQEHIEKLLKKSQKIRENKK